MDTLTLRAFVSVAEGGSVTAAAALLGFSQPGLSQRLQGLERALGCRLFLRDSGRMRLTAEGRSMLPYARMIVMLSDQMRQESPRCARESSPLADLPKAL